MIRPRYAFPGPPARLICSKCDSRRTQVVGRRDDSRTLVLRCNVCGSHSSVPTFDEGSDLPIDDTEHPAEPLTR